MYQRVSLNFFSESCGEEDKPRAVTAAQRQREREEKRKKKKDREKMKKIRDKKGMFVQSAFHYDFTICVKIYIFKS